MYPLKEPNYTIAILIIGIASAISIAAVGVLIDLSLDFTITEFFFLIVGAAVGLPIRFGRYLFESNFDNLRSLSLFSTPSLIAAGCSFFGFVLVSFLTGVVTQTKTSGLAFFTELNRMDISAITLDMANRTSAIHILWYALVIYSGISCATASSEHFDYKKRGFFN